MIKELTNRLNEVELNYINMIDKVEVSENTCNELL